MVYVVGVVCIVGVVSVVGVVYVVGLVCVVGVVCVIGVFSVVVTQTYTKLHHLHQTKPTTQQNLLTSNST